MGPAYAGMTDTSDGSPAFAGMTNTRGAGMDSRGAVRDDEH
jgi:hypothetical protein